MTVVMKRALIQVYLMMFLFPNNNCEFLINVCLACVSKQEVWERMCIWGANIRRFHGNFHPSLV